MTRGKLMDMLIDYAKEYVPEAVASITRNKHMNEYQGDDISQVFVRALIVDFVNFIASKQCIDLGLYTKDLDRKSNQSVQATDTRT